MKLPIAVVICAAIGMATMFPSAAMAQSRTSGCASPIVLNSTINRLELVCGGRNAELVEVVARLNALAKRQVLSPSDLSMMAAALNGKLDKISADTDEILLLMREVLGRLDIAGANPAKATTILRPYLDTAIDLSNRRHEVSGFIDTAGTSEIRTVFQLQGSCQVFVTPPRGTGFTVGLALLSDRGSPIWRSQLGTQGRYAPHPLSTGTYQFVMFAKRGAGQYSATIAARCD